MKKSIIVFIFNSPLSSGCDYVLQTMKIVSQTHESYGIALGDIISFYGWLRSNDRWIVKNIVGSTIIRPISILPGIRFRWVRMTAYVYTCLFLRLWLGIRFSGKKKYLWFFEPFHMPFLLNMFCGYQTIYDCVDYYPGFNANAKQEHELVMRRATIVFGNSDVLVGELKRQRNDVIKVPLGFAEELFRSVRVKPILSKKNHFTVGYIGSISDRLDYILLEKVIKRLPKATFMFIGHQEINVFGHEDNAAYHFELLLKYPNVQWIQGVSKQKIPSMLKSIDVGIIPYRTDIIFNRYSFPMKLFEYFYMGKPVISKPIEELKRFPKFAKTADSAEEWEKTITMLLARSWPEMYKREQRKSAIANSWEKKIQTMLQVIVSDQ